MVNKHAYGTEDDDDCVFCGKRVDSMVEQYGYIEGIFHPRCKE